MVSYSRGLLQAYTIPLKTVADENKRLEPLKIGKNTREIEQIYAQSPNIAPGFGFEPKYSAPKAEVLPLDDPGILIKTLNPTLYFSV